MTISKTVLAAMLALSAAAPAMAATSINAKDYNLFVIGGMTATGSDTEGAVAVGGNATFNGYSVGADPRGGAKNLTVGGNLSFTNGRVHGSTTVGGDATFQSHGTDGAVTVGRDATFTGGSTGGRIVIGRDAGFTNYGVGAGLPSSAVNLEVGRNLSFTNGSINGGYVVGGTTSAPLYITNPNPPQAGTVTVPAAPDFAAEGLRLRNLSTTLGAQTATGTVSSVSYGGPAQLTLTGTNAGLNVFSLTTAQMNNWSDFTLNIPVGAIALVNVSGTAAAMVGGGFHYSGGANYSSVLFNFHQATSLGFGNIGVLGSVLAPNAAYTPGGVTGVKMGWDGGVVDGQMFVASWNQTDYKQTQVNSRYFAGNLLHKPVPQAPSAAPVPEPATWAMMMLGFGLVGAMARRRGRFAAA